MPTSHCKMCRYNYIFVYLKCRLLKRMTMKEVIVESILLKDYSNNVLQAAIWTLVRMQLKKIQLSLSACRRQQWRWRTEGNPHQLWQVHEQERRKLIICTQTNSTQGYSAHMVHHLLLATFTGFVLGDSAHELLPGVVNVGCDKQQP